MVQLSLLKINLHSYQPQGVLIHVFGSKIHGTAIDRVISSSVLHGFENHGVGKSILDLTCSGAEMFEFFVCLNMGILPIMGMRKTRISRPLNILRPKLFYQPHGF